MKEKINRKINNFYGSYIHNANNNKKSIKYGAILVAKINQLREIHKN